MNEEHQALNQEESSPDSETLNSGESSAPMESSDGLLSTAEFVAHQESEDDGQEEGQGETDTDETDDKTDEKGPIPYNRFQEKVKQLQELSEKLAEAEKRNAELEGKTKTEPKQDQKQDAEKLNFKPMHVMSDDQLQDWLDKSPLEFISNLASQIIYEARRDIMGEIETRNRRSTYQTKLAEFGEKHDGFNDLLNSGKIEDFVRSNPGHDVFSAYYEMTSDKRESSVQEQIDKAVKEAVEKTKQEMQKNIQAKRQLRTIGTGASKPPAQDVELKDTSALGGLTSALAARLAARRKARAR